MVRTIQYDLLRDAELCVACPWWKVKDKNIETTPIHFVEELL